MELPKGFKWLPGWALPTVDDFVFDYHASGGKNVFNKVPKLE